jgi:hypothetical protein
MLLVRPIVPVMAEEPVDEIEALNERIGKAIKEDALPEDICKLAEARAWLIWPNQPH